MRINFHCKDTYLFPTTYQITIIKIQITSKSWKKKTTAVYSQETKIHSVIEGQSHDIKHKSNESHLMKDREIHWDGKLESGITMGDHKRSKSQTLELYCTPLHPLYFTDILQLLLQQFSSIYSPSLWSNYTSRLIITLDLLQLTTIHFWTQLMPGVFTVQSNCWTQKEF